MLNGWGETYLHVYTSTRDLNVLYIDGMSAMLSLIGTLDSQDVLLYGKVKPDFWNIWDEYGRASRLCKWAKDLNVEGFVRTNAGFELMWCNFEEGIERIQHLNLTDWWTEMTGEPLGKSPWGPGGPPTRPTAPPPPSSHDDITHQEAFDNLDDHFSYPGKYPCDYPGSCYPPTRHRGWSPFGPSTAWEWLRSATEVYSGQGENRVQLDTSRMVTAYGRVGLSEFLTTRDMAKHRLINMTNAASLAYRRDIEHIANRTWVSSGVDWRKIADMIVTRYGQRLPEIHKHLSNGTIPALKKARLVAASMIMPFSKSNNTLEENLQYCGRGFTTSIARKTLDLNEYKLLSSIEVVHSSICDFLFGFYDDFRTLQSPKIPPLIVNAHENRVVEKNEDWEELISCWKDKLTELMSKLDWKLWKTCKKACDADEICYLPIWPIGRHTFAGPGRPLPTLPSEPFCVNLDWYVSP